MAGCQFEVATQSKDGQDTHGKHEEAIEGTVKQTNLGGGANKPGRWRETSFLQVLSGSGRPAFFCYDVWTLSL